ncbi:MAG: class I SAM-dependent methyltransferase [Gammaproteobacteria bacterium]|nr:class I SAM-dependent methyltransferase [Gammaproteobacteria bacterium]
MSHATADPSPWVSRFAGLFAPGGPVLDLACGSGRHARLLARRGQRVLAVDRDPDAVAGLSGVAGVTTRCSDLEDGPWPFPGMRFDGIVVTNYLYRPLLPRLVDALADGGILIYETFMQGNESFGAPSNPDFLLRPNELLEVLLRHLTVVAFEQGEIVLPRPAMVQRLCALRGTKRSMILPESHR